ncbi:uncharacterized protein LAESUDRAFT_763126 [Laetiporus sulphureus 93-53]|uniref:Uncharacterized protein n=1 Tax=Laetiporus sulphureus 93-53 TaxID=1314785 RepID=A0A165C4G5_9APHY|nr:uncharacterized protein LAESUDRAFT_763126 [Laetiporus sulphureus 93-53]KZT02189.1 hypothetical protein LAESUDRAFT_763126 [Laetiporus sulphureus 93-53]
MTSVNGKQIAGGANHHHHQQPEVHAAGCGGHTASASNARVADQDAQNIHAHEQGREQGQEHGHGEPSEPPVHDEDRERELHWRVALVNLQSEIQVFRRARTDGNRERMEEAEDNIPVFIRAAADCHPDPRVRAKMYRDAAEWERATVEEREQLAHPLLYGIGLCLEAPLVVGGSLLHGAAVALGDVGKEIVEAPQHLWRSISARKAHDHKPSPQSRHTI